MGAFICKQPNGLYCRFSTVVDCPTDWNMTEEEYIELCVIDAIERARKQAKMTLEYHVKPFDWVVDDFSPNNMTEAEFDKFLQDVGYKKGE